MRRSRQRRAGCRAAYWEQRRPTISARPSCSARRSSGKRSACRGSRPTNRHCDEGYPQELAADVHRRAAALHRIAWQQKPIAALARGITAENAARLNVEYWEQQIARWAMRPIRWPSGASAG
jgi:hypothetical protein